MFNKNYVLSALNLFICLSSTRFFRGERAVYCIKKCNILLNILTSSVKLQVLFRLAPPCGILGHIFRCHLFGRSDICKIM